MTPEFFKIFLIHSATAILCGGVIGFDRQVRGRPAGLRTCIIVVLTSAFFVTMSHEFTPEPRDPSRILAALVSGVSFLGAGVIFSQGGRVQGITTASLIWTLAAIGAVIGLGEPIVAVAATVVIIVVLGSVDWAESKFARLRKEYDPKKDQWISARTNKTSS